ncbi:hypothetical protein BXY70_2259 [Roseovarius halotolerans]|uniref:Uncharacterized protein n=1 Tax=Roseovarius halotolerans TaxID=505353 RepID=A0A1X6YTG4_9RHOB|nr:DUF6525 family protein [Roseovarius halotolerans]RKT32909.1 hypothetical protein BXY70_2259 [Roseovarius halotolerans]SLN30993.1 hypothetical protein ROH8110_01446 [Roseovarius halotolerans]
MARNCRTGLPMRRRPSGDPMAEYDRLPRAARRWLAEATLPWSARSVRRVWQRALERSGGDEAAALAGLEQAEAARLRREAMHLAGAADGNCAGLGPQARRG